MSCTKRLNVKSPRAVTVIYDSVENPIQRLTYPCDAELGVTFGDSIADLFKVYNCHRSKVAINKYSMDQDSVMLDDKINFIEYYYISNASKLQSPCACEWINSTLAKKLAAEKAALEAQKEKTNTTASNE